MKIIQHRLHNQNEEAFPFTPSPNKSGQLHAKFIVIHYSSGPGAAQTVAWLCQPQAQASAHLVIGRDGAITQLVAFNEQAWHAGHSEWEGYTGMNQYAIGIELDNAGKLERHGSHWRSWFGQEYRDDAVLQAVHKHENERAGWHLYSPLQIQSALDVCLALKASYNIENILGHDDIAPGRKLDPGPAFPMPSFRSRVLGRSDNRPRLYVTTTDLNIRSGPGTEYSIIDGSPLPPGTKVEIIQADGRWRRVDVWSTVNNINDLQGWVHGRYLNPAGE